VFKIVDGRARLQPLSTGPRNGMVAVVVSGLDAGTPMIVYPGDAVADGVRVTARVRRR